MNTTTTQTFCIASDNFKDHNVSFQMAYKPLETMWLPALFSLCFYAVDFWLLFTIPFGTSTLSLFLLAFLTGALAAPVIGFWAINQHGSFVMGADKKGIYYKKLNEPEKIVFVDWESVNTINIKETGKRTLIIETTLNKYKKDSLPVPCNGSIHYLDRGIICLEFNTSFLYKTDHILKSLNKLKQRYFIAEVKLNTDS